MSIYCHLPSHTACAKNFVVHIVKQNRNEIYFCSLKFIFTAYIYICVLGAKDGFGQSTDVTTQSVDPCFAQTITGMFHVQIRPRASGSAPECTIVSCMLE